jgi:hypothetical protein
VARDDVKIRGSGASGAMVAGGLALALSPMPARVHLIETGLGPVYDGIIHFALTAEGLPPYSSSHYLPLGLV